MKRFFDFKFKEPSNGNAPEYAEIRSGKRNGTIDPITYHIIPKDKGDIMFGPGVTRMQERLATVFKIYKPDLYKKYFDLNTLKDNKLFNSVTDGRYNARTMQMVMDFQKIYMYDFRSKEDQIPTIGFGSFGGNTKAALNDWYIKAYKKAKQILAT